MLRSIRCCTRSCALLFFCLTRVAKFRRLPRMSPFTFNRKPDPQAFLWPLMPDPQAYHTHALPLRATFQESQEVSPPLLQRCMLFRCCTRSHFILVRLELPNTRDSHECLFSPNRKPDPQAFLWPFMLDPQAYHTHALPLCATF